MKSKRETRSGVNVKKNYEIIVKGRISDYRFDSFGGMAISRLASGKTKLAGSVVDQPQLHGILSKVRNMVLTMLIVSNFTTQLCLRRMKMKVKPIGDRVLIKPKLGDDVTKGGIVIPDTAREKTTEGVVIAVGDDKELIKVKVKDHVLYDRYAGIEIKLDGKDHLILKMEDVLAVLE